MTRRAASLLMILLPGARLWAGDSAIDAREVMHRVNARARGQDSRMLLRMTIRDPRRGQFQKVVDVARKRFGAAYRTLYRIDAPDHERGIGLLLSEGAPAGIWMYFPSTQKAVPVASRSFPAMATDFNCEDLLVNVEMKDFDFRALGRGSEDGFPAILVEMTPRTEALRNELGFTRSVGWVRDDIWMIARADYYDESGSLFKTFRAGDAERTGQIWTARRMSMENHRIGHSTEVRVEQIDYSPRFSGEAFTPNRMGADLIVLPR